MPSRHRCHRRASCVKFLLAKYTRTYIMQNEHMKPLNFIGSGLDDLRNFPEEARKAAGFELYAIQRGLVPSDWKPMSSIGRGVKEIRIHVLGEWRIIYVATFEDAVHVLHSFQKKTRTTNQHDIEIARKRYKQIGG